METRVAITDRWMQTGKGVWRRLRRGASKARRSARRASFLLASHSLDALLPHPGGSGGQAYARWRRELDSEVAFWRRWIAHTPGPALDERRRRLDPETPLQDWVRDLLGTPLLGTPESETLRLLDVGAGPATQLGKRWPGRTVTITAIDPLADQYNCLLASYGLRAPVPSRVGHGEQLDALVPPDSFDLAYAVNALDHSYDPLAVIQAMLRATKPGGWLALDHYVDEAEHERYEGLHQWNFRAEDGRFVIWNQARRVVVDDYLQNAAEIRVDVAHGEKDWLMVRIRKAQPIAPPQAEGSA
jgi:SAM-dependent methyltransferase